MHTAVDYDNLRPISETELWFQLGEYELDRVEWSFCAILQLVRHGARFDEPDPITRLWHILLLRGEKVTLRMLVCYVNTVGYRIVHPRVHELIRKKRARVAVKTVEPTNTRAMAKPKKVPAKPRGSSTVFHLGDPEAASAMLARCGLPSFITEPAIQPA